MKKEQIGKTLIGLGILLLAVPFVTAVIHDLSMFAGRSVIAGRIRQNFTTMGGNNPNVFLLWLGNIIYSTYSRIGSVQIFFRFLFLQNVLCLLIPNLLIVFGFSVLIAQKQNIGIGKCFNKTVIIGLVLSVLVLFNFFGLSNLLFTQFYRTVITARWFSFLPWNVRMSSGGRFLISFTRTFVSLLFRIVLIAPTFVIIAGFMQFFKKEKTKPVISENVSSANVPQSEPAVSVAEWNLPLSKMKLKFNGGVLAIFLFPIWSVPFITITLGFAIPWIICIVIRWVCENTTIGGKAFRFTGTGGGLFGRYILWSFLTIITFGIYGFWATRNYIRWVIDNIEANIPAATTDAKPEQSSFLSQNRPPINRNYGDTWTCKKCNEVNPSTSLSCKGCGAYK